MTSHMLFARRRVDAIERWFVRLDEDICNGKETAGPGAKALRTVEAPSDGSDCPICLDNKAGTAVWKEMPCTHRFHEACLDKWLIKDKEKASCPLCRRKLNPPSELDDVYIQLRNIIQKYGKHLLGDNYHKWSAPERTTADWFYKRVVGVDQCLRVASGLLAEALPQVASEMRLSVQGARARIELAQAKLMDANAALLAARASADNIAESLTPPVDGRVLQLLPARASIQAAYDLGGTGRAHLMNAIDRRSDGLLPHRPKQLAAVGALEAALQEARAGVEVTSAALADDSLRRLRV